VRAEPHEVFSTCGRCHDAGGKLLAKSQDLCVRCHGEVRREAEKADAHPAMAEGCVTCHTPHAADRPGLLAGASERGVCLSCHGEVRDAQKAFLSVHPESGAAGACSACHTGHRSDQPALLKAPPQEVCKTCHEGHSQFSHPMGTGVIDPRTGRDVTCLSCHGPHGTMFPMILTESPQRALCVQCHSDAGASRAVKGAPAGHGGTAPPPGHGGGAPPGRP